MTSFAGGVLDIKCDGTGSVVVRQDGANNILANEAQPAGNPTTATATQINVDLGPLGTFQFVTLNNQNGEGLRDPSGNQIPAAVTASQEDSVQLVGRTGSDNITVGTGQANLDGKGPAETTYNTTTPQIFGAGGDDTIDAGGSTDNLMLDGGEGNDILTAGSAASSVDGGAAIDELFKQWTDNADTITINSTQVASAEKAMSYAGIEKLTVNGLGGDDIINITGFLQIPATVNGGAGGDTINVDASSAGSALTLNGGDPTASPGDGLNISGGPFANATFNHANASDGSIDLDSNMISYTGLELITFAGMATNLGFNLPATNSKATLAADDDGMSTLSSSTGSFADTTFKDPWAVSIDYGDGSGRQGLTLDNPSPTTSYDANLGPTNDWCKVILNASAPESVSTQRSPLTSLSSAQAMPITCRAGAGSDTCEVKIARLRNPAQVTCIGGRGSNQYRIDAPDIPSTTGFERTKDKLTDDITLQLAKVSFEYKIQAKEGSPSDTIKMMYDVKSKGKLRLPRRPGSRSLDDVVDLRGLGIPAIVNAGAGDDEVFGGEEADVLNGEEGNDQLNGSGDNDEVDCGPGRRDVGVGGQGKKDRIARNCEVSHP